MHSLLYDDVHIGITLAKELTFRQMRMQGRDSSLIEFALQLLSSPLKDIIGSVSQIGDMYIGNTTPSESFGEQSQR